MKLLITGATGKVGGDLIGKILSEPRFSNIQIRALCHNRVLAEGPRLEVLKGTISDRDCANAAMDGVTHVLHLATCKETPDDIMDVAVKGLFWILEECRASRGV